MKLKLVTTIHGALLFCTDKEIKRLIWGFIFSDVKFIVFVLKMFIIETKNSHFVTPGIFNKVRK